LNIILLSMILGGGGGGVLFYLIIYIIILTTIIYSTNKSIKRKEKGNVPISADQTSKVLLVTFLGGIIGANSGSTLDRINTVIKKENEQGWKAVQIFHADDGGFFLEMLRALLLVCTLFMYTTANGYYIIMEREISGKQMISGNQMSGERLSKILRCPNCGKEYAPEMKDNFCEECGHKL